MQVLKTPADVAEAAADLFVREAARASAETGSFGVALSGGATPTRLFATLRTDPWRARVNWKEVHFFWGDERCVPPSHKDSNFGGAKRELLDHVPVSPDHIHRIVAEGDPVSAAKCYDDDLRSFVRSRPGGRLGLDLVFLGLGADGHTASLFPGTTAASGRVTTKPEWVVAHHVPQIDSWRITLTAEAINLAECVAFLVTGKTKANSLAKALSQDGTASLPAALIRPRRGNLSWLVDESAARSLSIRPRDRAP